MKYRAYVIVRSGTRRYRSLLVEYRAVFGIVYGVFLVEQRAIFGRL